MIGLGVSRLGGAEDVLAARSTSGQTVERLSSSSREVGEVIARIDDQQSTIATRTSSTADEISRAAAELQQLLAGVRF